MNNCHLLTSSANIEEKAQLTLLRSQLNENIPKLVHICHTNTNTDGTEKYIYIIQQVVHLTQIVHMMHAYGAYDVLTNQQNEEILKLKYTCTI